MTAALVACGGAHHDASHGSSSSSSSSSSSDGDDDGRVERIVKVEKTPHGTRTTVIEKRTEEAPPPPARAADPWPDDPAVKYNVDLLNSYRARAKLPPLLYDAKISAFALAGSKQLASDHKPHAHFAATSSAPGLGTHTAENQGDPNGGYPMDSDALESKKKQIAMFLKLMMDEGPGGGHHDNIMNKRYRRIGVGLYMAPGGKLYLTNDFSD